MAFLTTTLHFIFTVIFTMITSTQSSTFAERTVYEVLESHDFPIGLLPNGVTSYNLNDSTGEFLVHFNETCSFMVQSHEIKYETPFTGVITKGRLHNLNGVQVKLVFAWLRIVEVIRDGDELEFSAGIASARFDVNNFVECPACGCGFDCDGDLNEGNIEKLESAIAFSY